MPPALIAVGTLDGFVDEDIEYAKRLNQAGVPVELHVYPGGPHGFDTLAPGTVLGRPWTHGRRPEPRDFIEWDRPGYCKAAMNFRLEDDADGWVRLSTETRVFATSEQARRNFALYWRVIYPGSALIRREWLKAIRRRAEAAGATARIRLIS